MTVETLLTVLVSIEFLRLGVAVWALTHQRLPRNPHGPIK